MASSSTEPFKQQLRIKMGFLVNLGNVNYYKEMQKLAANLNYVNSNDMDRFNSEASSSTVKLICGTKSLTEKQIVELEKSLNDTFGQFEKVNLRKKDSKSPAIGIHLGHSTPRLAVYDGLSHKIIPVNLSNTKIPSLSKVAISADDPKENVEVLAFSLQSSSEQNLLLMKQLKQTADKFIGQDVLNVVVAIPADFNHVHRRNVKKACLGVGLNVLQIITEPTSAVVAYNLHKIPRNAEVNYCLVFQFDYFKLDVSVLTICDNQIHITAFKKDDHLGKQIEKNVVDYCIDEFKRVHGVHLREIMESTDNDDANIASQKMSQLKSECRKQKQFLIESQNVSRKITVFKMYKDINLEVKMQRGDFNSICKRVFQKCFQTVDWFLEKAEVDRYSIDDVVLVGGSSRIPKVQEMLSDYFGEERMRRSIDLDEAVAVGAAMLAFKPENVEIQNVIFQEEQLSGTKCSYSENQVKPLQVKTEEGTLTKNAQVYPDCWRYISCQELKRFGHAAVDVNGIIYSFGGESDNHSEKDPIDIYVLNTSESAVQWKLLLVTNNDNTPSKRLWNTAVASGHLIYLWGGRLCTNKLHVFNTATLEWEKCEVKGEVPANKYLHTSTVVKDKMYVFGGWDNVPRISFNTVSYLDLSTLCWSTVSPKDPPPPRDSHSATVHGDRFILIFGGLDEKYERFNSLVCLDAETNEWIFPKVTGTIPQPRSRHCAFNHNGFMYIFGGSGNSGYLNDLFRYDIETMEWTKINPEGPSPDSRVNSQSVVIKDQVFIFGGKHDNGDICDDTFVLTIGFKQIEKMQQQQKTLLK